MARYIMKNIFIYIALYSFKIVLLYIMLNLRIGGMG
jgi:hypothetical protein